MWLCMAGAFAGIIAVAQVITEKQIPYNPYDFAKFVDVKLWIGQLLGGLLLKGIYLWAGRIEKRSAKDFKRRVNEDINGILVNFGWLFLISVPVFVHHDDGVKAVENYLIGIINLVLVYNLAAKQDGKDLVHRSSKKASQSHCHQSQKDEP